MAHRRAKLTPFGRLLLVQRVEDLEWTVPQAAQSAGVSRATAYKWLRRFREHGIDGLEDRSARPAHSPRRTAPETEAKVATARLQLRVGPNQLASRLKMPASTIHVILRRRGLSRLSDLDRSSGIPIRYVRERPGELVHLDIKKLAKIPVGGGHAKLGREHSHHGRAGLGYEYIHVAVDDCSRVAYAEIHENERGSTAARFLLSVGGFLAAQGVRIERVMTDGGFCYTQAADFRDALEMVEARHKRIPPYRPQVNGKAEAFIKTLLREWAYRRLYTSNDERRAALNLWLAEYNHTRGHSELHDQAPWSVLVNKVHGDYT